MPIRHWPSEERPREKLLSRGPAALSDAELLAIFLRTGVRGRTAVDIARDLLLAHDGLRGLLNAPIDAICRNPGLGVAKAVQLHAALEVGRRFLAERLLRGAALSSPDDAREFLQARLRDRDREVFACLFLDQRNRVVAYEALFEGTLNAASIHPREVVRRAMTLNAASVIAAHNHPSGVAEPSRADEVVTRRLREALELVDVRLLDHLVVGDGETVSLRERGLF